MIQTARKILLTEGLKTLTHSAWWFVYRRTLRRLMPVTEPDVRLIDDVKFRNHTKSPRRMGDDLLAWKPHTYGQKGESNAHRRFTRHGDHVCIVGGGRGTTAVHAARQVRDEGSVTVYEGGKIASLVREVAQLNDVDDVIEVFEVIVGEANTLYQGMANEAEVVDPADLPPFDVLEMDCEGSELGILERLNIRPRVIIVELHPSMYDGPNDAPLQEIEWMGYEIASCSTQLGEHLSQQKFENRLARGCGDVLTATRPEKGWRS